MLQRKNQRKVKKFMIYSFLDFCTFKEKIALRLVCQNFNQCVMNVLDFLKTENFIAMSSYWLEDVRMKYDESYRKRKPIRDMCNESVLFSSNHSQAKFSKKRILIKLLNAGDYQAIKKQKSLRRLLLPKSYSINN